jgi:hypothetical protein
MQTARRALDFYHTLGTPTHLLQVIIAVVAFAAINLL